MVRGVDLEDLFLTGVHALYHGALGESADSWGLCSRSVALEGSRELSLRTENLVDLFHDWLTEWLFFLDSRREVLKSVVFESLSRTELVCRFLIQAVPWDVGGTEIKAVTYHELAVERTPEGWQARMILDV